MVLNRGKESTAVFLLGFSGIVSWGAITPQQAKDLRAQANKNSALLVTANTTVLKQAQEINNLKDSIKELKNVIDKLKGFTAGVAKIHDPATESTEDVDTLISTGNKAKTTAEDAIQALASIGAALQIQSQKIEDIGNGAKEQVKQKNEVTKQLRDELGKPDAELKELVQDLLDLGKQLSGEYNELLTQFNEQAKLFASGGIVQAMIDLGKLGLADEQIQELSQQVIALSKANVSSKDIVELLKECAKKVTEGKTIGEIIQAVKP